MSIIILYCVLKFSHIQFTYFQTCIVIQCIYLKKNLSEFNDISYISFFSVLQLGIHPCVCVGARLVDRSDKTY